MSPGTLMNMSLKERERYAYAEGLPVQRLLAIALRDEELKAERQHADAQVQRLREIELLCAPT